MNIDQNELRENLFRHVDMLAGIIGVRNVYKPGTLETSVAYISKICTNLGYTVSEQLYEVEGQVAKNLEVEIRGTTRPAEILLVGGHYDSVLNGPGANDNASAVAATLEIARLLSSTKPARTIRFLAFVNEEPPFYHTEKMGSLVYARQCRQRNENIVGMICLETIGCYFDEPGTQKYPFPVNLFYPSTGNFIAFVANRASRLFMNQCKRSFQSHTDFPIIAAALPEFIRGIGWSDHWSFWKCGYPAIMVTDTAPYRYVHYHRATDTPDKINYEKMSQVVAAITKVVNDLATEKS